MQTPVGGDESPPAKLRIYASFITRYPGNFCRDEGIDIGCRYPCLRGAGVCVFLELITMKNNFLSATTEPTSR